MTRMDTRLQKIRKFIDDSDDDTNYHLLFSSRAGQDFGKKMSELSGFVLAFCLAGVPSGEIQKEYIRMLKDGRVEELRNIPGAENGFEEFLELFKCLAKLPESSFSDSSKVIGKRNAKRFLALLTFSASAYLDVYLDAYLDSILDTIEESPTHLEQVLTYLKENEYVNRRDQSSVTSFKQVCTLGSGQRIELLNEVFMVKELCQEYIDSDELNRFQEYRTYFIRLKGNIVHGKPEPSLKMFDDKLFRQSRRALEKHIKEY